jgi:hypothetical protein
MLWGYICLHTLLSGPFGFDNKSGCTAPQPEKGAEKELSAIMISLRLDPSMGVLQFVSICGRQQRVFGGLVGKAVKLGRNQFTTRRLHMQATKTRLGIGKYQYDYL